MKYILALLLLAQTTIAADNPDIIVKWHTLRVTADYSSDLASTKSDEFLFVWVGSVDFDIFNKLEKLGHRQSYVKSLPGYDAGLIIGKGKYFQEAFSAKALINPETVELVLKKYKTLSLEEKLLGYEQKLIKSIPVQVQAAPIQVKAAPIQVQAAPVVQAGMHKHQCGRCGAVWAHSSGSHKCPNGCKGEWLQQYQGPRPAMVVH